MSQQIIWQAEAAREYEDALAWYDERSIFAAKRLAKMVGSRIAQIGDNPLRFSFSQRGHRWAQVPRFPYQIHYLETKDGVTILAFWHEKRGRESLNRRLKGQ